MTTFTRAELVTRVLQKHRVVGEGQPASEEQRAVVDGVIDPALEELARRNVVTVDAAVAMPIVLKEHLADFLLYFCATDFGRAPDVAGHQLAESNLRAIEADRPTFQPMKVDYMMRGGSEEFTDYSAE